MSRSGIGSFSGDPQVDSFDLRRSANMFSTPSVGTLNSTYVPPAGWHVELTEPIIWGKITLNGIVYNLPTGIGNIGETLTISGMNTLDWEPTVHSLSFGTTGLTPSVASSNAITVGGTLSIAHGGTGQTNANSALNALLPSQFGNAGTVLSTDGTNTGWTSTYNRTFSAGSTGFSPNSPTSGDVVLTGILNTSSGGTGINSVGTSGTTLVSNGSTLSYGYPDQATNLSGGSLWTVPYQSTTNVTAFVPAGISGQVLSANTGAAPSWGPGSLTIGTTPIALGAAALSLSGVDFITLTQDPPTAFDAATKQYVDARTGALNNLGSVVAATLGDIVLSGLQTIDGVTLIAGDSVLVKNQILPAQEGIYIASAGAWSYASYANTWADYVGALVFVAGGTQSGSSWTQTTGPGGTLGVTNQSWAQIGAAIAYVGGPGISVVGGTINNTGVLSFAGGTTGLTPSLATTGAITLAGTLQIANGGTGLTALGTGVQSALGNAVNAANGFSVLNGSGVLAIAQGGTGAATATAAINNLLPSQASQNGKYLTTDGSNVSWAANPLGTVTSVDVSGGTTGLTTSGGPITTSGVITIAGILNPSNGGTGITSLGAGVATWLGTPTSANLRSAVSDETGTGSLVFATSPTLVTPILGTPQSGNFSTGTFTWPTFNQNTTGTASNVTGTVAIANGGTGLTSVGSNGTVLTSNGTTASWAALPASGVVDPGLANQIAYYAADGTTVVGWDLVTINSNALVLGADGVSSGYLTLKNGVAEAVNIAPAVATTNWTMTLPTTAGTSGQFLTTNGSGVTSWTSSTNLLGYTNSATPFNTALGANAGDSITSCTDSVFIGYNAGTNVTTAVNVIAIGSGALDNATGPTNAIAIGKDALGSATTGAINNIAIGASCMSAGLSGSNNVAIGVGAGQPITNGTQNTLIGGAAGGAMTSGVDNVAVGYQSLDACNTGTQNVAIGKGSLGALTNGASNVAVGFNALAVTTTASNNVAVGTSAGTNISSGTFNAIFGNSAALSLNTGSNNAIFGYTAGDALTSGSNSAAFGSNALGSATGGGNAAFGYNSGSSITTGTNNTILGSYVGTAALTGACVLSDGAGNIRLYTNSSGALSFNGSSFGTTGQVLTSNGSAAIPTWVTPGTFTSDISIQGTTVGVGGGNVVGNVAFGVGALASNVAGSLLIAIGEGALASSVNANDNVAIGYNALTGSTVGVNLAVGNFALESLSTGTQNTAIGENAGSGITTGSNNTLVGTYTGTATLTGACVISDGSGNIRLYTNSSGALSFNGSSFGTTGQVLVSNGSAAVPTWQNLGSVVTGYWAGIYDTTASQTAALANTAYAVALGSIDPDSNGISVAAGTRITVANAGVYTFAPSLQIRNTDSNIHELNIWFRKNGADLANSNSRFSITASHGGTDGFSVPAVVFTTKLAAADYVELMWSVTNVAVEIYTVPATAPAPAAPGVIVSVSAV